MALLERITGTPTGEHLGWFFWCPACSEPHPFGVKWAFNGNLEKPTFSPSLRVLKRLGEGPETSTTCHLFVTEGLIRYEGDCPHAMKGKVVPMVPIDGGAPAA